MAEILFNFAVRKAWNRMLCMSNIMDLQVKMYKYICYYVWWYSTLHCKWHSIGIVKWQIFFINLSVFLSPLGHSALKTFFILHLLAPKPWLLNIRLSCIFKPSPSPPLPPPKNPQLTPPPKKDVYQISIICDWKWHFNFSVPSYTTVWKSVPDHSVSTLWGTASRDSKKPENVAVGQVEIT